MTAAWCRNVLVRTRVAPGEQAVVLVDEPLHREAERLLEALEAAGADTALFLLPPDALEEAPPELLEVARRADVWISLWERPRRITAANRQVLETVRAAGARILGMPLVTRELLEDELSRPLPDLEPVASRLLDELGGAREVHVRGPAGTDLTLDVGGCSWYTDALPLEPGRIANHPSGEVYVLPSSAEGRLVADLTVPYVSETLLETPLEITFVAGEATSIDGGPSGRKLRELVDGAGPPADRIAELGIGVNPTLATRGHVLIDEKIAGTAHVAIGSTIHMGGTQLAPIHVDCVFRVSDLRADGTAVVLPRLDGVNESLPKEDA
jgi:leucyl aminopeptidase (aminopeptidase T)